MEGNKGGKKVRDIEGDRDSNAGAGCTRYQGLVSFLRLRFFGLCSFTFEWYAHVTGLNMYALYRIRVCEYQTEL
jgi:hypothetical protein